MSENSRHPEMHEEGSKMPAYDRSVQRLSEDCGEERRKLKEAALKKLNDIVKKQGEVSELDDQGRMISWEEHNRRAEEYNKAAKFVLEIESMPCYKVRYWNQVYQVEGTPLSPTNAIDLFMQSLLAENAYLQAWIQDHFVDPLKMTQELPEILQASTLSLQSQYQAIGQAGGAEALPGAYQAVKGLVEKTIEAGRQELARESDRTPGSDDGLNIYTIGTLEEFLKQLLVGFAQLLAAEGAVESKPGGVISFDREEFLRSQLFLHEKEAMEKEMAAHPDAASQAEFSKHWMSETEAIRTATGEALEELCKRYGMDPASLPPNAHLYYALKSTIMERCGRIDEQTQGERGMILAGEDDQKYQTLRSERQQLGTLSYYLTVNDRAGLERTARQLGLHPEDYPG